MNRPTVHPRRQAFSLMELLIVIGILATLSALSAGAFLATQRSGGVVGAEQAVIDAVRLGRHLARTSGAPVILHLAKDGDELTGAVQTPLWHLVPRNGRGIAAGPSSTAVWLNGKNVDGSDLFLPSDLQLDLGLSKRDDIGRSADDALVIDLTLRTPPTSGFPMTSATQAPIYQPLVLVGSAGDITINESLIGLVLSSQRVQVTGESNPSMTVPSWSVSYWARRTGQTTVTVHDWTAGLPGGVWQQLGLRIDDQGITLLHQGRVVERISETGALAAPTTPSQIMLGQIKLPYLTDDTYATGVTVAEIRLSRLRQGIRQRFGGGLTSTADYRIECLPDGRILTTIDNATVPQRTSTLSLSSKSSGLGTSITISSDGTVSSTVASL